MADKNTISSIGEVIGRALSRLEIVLGSDEEFIAFARKLGWNVTAIPTSLLGLSSAVETLAGLLDSLDDEESNFTAYDSLLSAVKNVFDQVQDLESAQFDASLADLGFASEFPTQVIHYLLAEYLVDNYPDVGNVLTLFGVIKADYEPSAGDRPAFFRTTIEWGRLIDVLNSPADVFRDVFGWGSGTLDSETIMFALRNMLSGLGMAVYYETVPDAVAAVLDDGVRLEGEPERKGLFLPVFEGKKDGTDFEVGVAVLQLFVSGSRLPGFAFLPYATGDLSTAFSIDDQTTLKLTSSFDVTGGFAIILRPGEDVTVIDGLSDPDNAAVATGSVELSMEQSSSSEENPIVLIGTQDATRLEVGSISFTAGLNEDSRGPNLYVDLTLGDGKFIVDLEGGDGFIRTALGSTDIEGTFDLSIGWSTQDGLFFGGSGGLEVTIPVCIDLMVLVIDAISIALRPSDSKLDIDLGAIISTDLGPLLASIDSIGLTATFDFTETAGNLGPFGLALGFKAPTKISLSIDSQGFTGGGFLYLDADKGEYSGGLELSFNNMLTISAIGFITTKMTDGSVGYSLLLIISTEFTPIQLGFGFTLNGVGGLFGYNRSVDLEELRDGVKTGAYDQILFPSDIVANANQIVSDIVSIFPTEDGQFLFGPMAKIGWGTPTLLTVELGLIIEIPDPVQLAILGVLKAILPDEDNDLLRIQVNFLGTIDFEAGAISFDATIFDSSLIAFTLSGDMAFRLIWGDDPNFLITLGGFHPAYNPPPLSLPDLDRLTIKLVSGNNPRITIETYFAVTSNTAQFGAKADVYAEAWKVYVSGYMSFDALFQFSPFWFTVGMSAMVDVGMGDSVLMSVRLDVDLEGPSPWKASGEASFKVLGVKVDPDFKKTFGEAKDTTLPDVPVLPLLVAALENTSNWLAELPDRSRLSVTLGEISVSPGEIVAHPAGTLKVSQKVVPLEITIETFGAQKPSDATRFEIDKVTSGTTTLSTSDVEEYFAPAQFESLSDSEKLSRNSFEKMTSGVQINSSSDLQSSKYLVRDVEYEQIIVDSTFITRLLVLLAQSMASFPYLIAGSSSAQASYSYVQTGPSSLASEPLSITQEGFSVVGVEDLTLADEQSTLGSEAAAYAYMNELIKKNPSLASEIQVVPNYEVATA